MHKQRIGVLVAAALGMIATFLPWLHAPIVGTVAGTVGDGWVSFALFAIALILAILGNRSLSMSSGNRMGAVVLGLLAAVYGIWKYMSFNDLSSEIGSSPGTDEILSTMSVGIGV